LVWKLQYLATLFQTAILKITHVYFCKDLHIVTPNQTIMKKDECFLTSNIKNNIMKFSPETIIKSTPRSVVSCWPDFVLVFGEFDAAVLHPLPRGPFVVEAQASGSVSEKRITVRVARWFVFKPKIPIWVKFGGSCYGRWFILWPFGLFYRHWKYFMASWFILW
jgi:hypothetical protein